MNYKFFIILSLIALCSCQNKKDAKSVSKEHKVKSIHFEEFSLIDISSNAQNDLQSWKSFQSLMQVIVGMAPTKIKNTENLVNSHPDSLLIYNRLPAQNPQTILENAVVERDWRTNNNVKDTIFRFEKKKEGESAWVQWNKFLVKDIPYTLSVFAKSLNHNQIVLEFTQTHTIYKDSFDLSNPNSENLGNKKIKSGDDNWKELQLTFTPSKEGSYGIRLVFDENTKNGSSILFYRPTLQIPAKYFSKIGQFSDKIVQEQSTVESSYYSVFFWLRQIEDELKQLLADDQSFPEKIKANAIKARFRLFETQVKELADNVKNNPDFQESEVKSHIKKLQNTFNDIILHINKFYDSDLDERMKHISTQVDTLTETATNNVPMLHTEKEKQSDTK